MTNQIFTEDCRETLNRMPDKFLNCCVTSPPYYGLRDYGHDGQIGLEETPEAYVANLVEVFRLIRDKMQDDGTLWLNLGDSYVSATSERNPEKPKGATGCVALGTAAANPTNGRGKRNGQMMRDGLKMKDLIGIPWMVAFALRADGWYLRQDIIWHKPNPMPESVTDRCTKSHEYIFLLSKSKQYYYDADAIKENAVVEYRERTSKNGESAVDAKTRGYDNQMGSDGYRNKRSVWTVTTKPYPDAHFATYPEDLIIPCILAGCPERGIVYDPFMGAATTALVALRANRQFIGSELNPEYVKIGMERIKPLLTQYSLF